MTDDTIKVLYIDDDEDDYVLIRRFLKDIAPVRYTLHWARSAEEALVALEISRFDVCLLDYYLGEDNGLSLLGHLSRNDARLPVILLTTSADRNTDVEVMQAGAVDFLVKSEIHPALLERSIRYAMDRKKMEQELRASVAECSNKGQSLERANRALRTINECNQALVRETVEQDLLERLCTTVVEAGGYRLAWVGYVEDGPEKPVRPMAQAGYDAGYLQSIRITGKNSATGQGPAGTAIRTGKPSCTQDLLTLPDHNPWRAEAIKRGYASSLALPLKDGELVFGALSIYAREPDAFDAEETALLQSLADKLAFGINAIRTQHQREAAEQQLRQSESKYRMIFEHSPLGIFHFDSDGIITACNDSLARIFDCSKEDLIGYSIPAFLADEQLKSCIAACFSGERPHYEGYYDSQIASRTIPLQLDLGPIFDQHGAFAGGIGIIEDISPRKQAEEALQKSERQLRSLSARLLTAQEEERQRIARELHDSIGSSLAAIKLNLGSFRKKLSDPSQQDTFHNLLTLTEQTIKEMRRIMNALRPPMLDDLGLKATISWFCRQYQTLYPGISTNTNLRLDETAIPESLKMVIFRIIQESFNNAAKYSQADRVELSLRHANSTLLLTIRDNGVGFEADTVDPAQTQGNGFGLTGMKERAELSGGSFRIRSVPGKGTWVEASWSADTSKRP